MPLRWLGIGFLFAVLGLGLFAAFAWAVWDWHRDMRQARRALEPRTF